MLETTVQIIVLCLEMFYTNTDNTDSADSADTTNNSEDRQMMMRHMLSFLYLLQLQAQ